MDTAHRVMAQLDVDELEAIKRSFVNALIEQHLLRRFRLLGKYYTIAIDGTGVNSYKENNEEQVLPSKTSKNGVVAYYSHVVEAKLVTSSGFAISIGSEWVTNQSELRNDFDKQDCEQKAFERLAQKIKKHFPRLPVCILADGLYPNKTFMKICQDNGWAYIVVLKDKSLKTLQEDITDIELKHCRSLDHETIDNKGKRHTHRKYEWITETLVHAGHTVYWVSCTETVSVVGNDKTLSVEKITRFVNLANIKIDKDNVQAISEAGRMRWKIENEGFNTQKNGGYNLGHKYARKSFTAHQNYYQCMQIAHTINQLVEKSKAIAEMRGENNKLTLKHIWKQWLTWMVTNKEHIEVSDKFQIRLSG